MNRSVLSMLVMFFCATLPGLAQNVVTGKVTGANGEGLPGVNVVLKGSTTGTMTDVRWELPDQRFGRNAGLFLYRV